MSGKITEYVLFLCTLLSGFYGGIGFFGKMGFNPSLELMSNSTFAEYWQHLDHFMAARMRIFGPILLFTTIIATAMMLKEYRTSSFWLMVVALVLLVIDVYFTVTVNLPLNQLIQSWDLKHLPANVEEIKWRVIRAFRVRTTFMIAGFFMVLLAVWLRKNR
jgi:hypothetical protein